MMRQIDMEGIGHFVHSNGEETLNISYTPPYII